MNAIPERFPNPAESYQVRQLIDSLACTKTPCRDLVEVARQANAPGTPAFARYAGLALADAGALALADAPPDATVKLERPLAGGFAQLSCAATAGEELHRLVADVEATLNRLIDMADTLEYALLAMSSRQKRVTLSFMGADYAPATPEHRSGRIELPRAAADGSWDLTFFSELDWRVLDHVAGDARIVFQSCLRTNMRQTLLGAHAPDGSDWDVRTRLASLLGRLGLPFRFRAGFDVADSGRTALVAFQAPSTSFLPHRHDGKEIGALADVAHMTYTLRLVCLAAAACFGAGKHVETAFVRVRGADGSTLLDCSFERDSFVRSVLVALDDQTLFDPTFRFDPEALVKVMAPAWFRAGNESPVFAETHTATGLSVDKEEASELHGDPPTEEAPLPASTCAAAAQRVEPWRDERPLPPALAQLFATRRICDIDTAHYLGSSSDIIDEARSDAKDASMAAIAQLEEIAAELGDTLKPPDDDPHARPLYCGNPLARAALPLLSDLLSVGADAEAYLKHATAAEPSIADQAQRFLQALDSNDGTYAPANAATSAPPTFYRAPSALFHAHIGLSDMYQRLGDVAGALAHADFAIALAPTTAGAYFRKADILAEERRYAEAANILTAGLALAVSKQDCALLYYHLGLVFTHMGRSADAAAIQVYAASLRGEFARRASEIVMQMRKKKGGPVIAFASPVAAAHEMLRAGIPVSPSDEARTLVAQAALGLANANAPLAAAPYAAELANYFADDPIITATYESLRHGLAATPIKG